MHVMTDERRKLLKEDDTNIKAEDCSLVADLSGMNQVIDVDKVAKTVTVESGITI